MAEFHNITVTNDGMKLIALASAMQKPIVFDRMDIGDSRPTDASKVASLTAVVSKRIEASISDIGVVTNADVSEARYRILGKYSNSTVTTGFKLSEVGVIAHVESNYYQDAGWNGYAGENLLFGYFYADAGKEDWLPSKDTPMDDLQMGAYFTVSNATNIAVYINEEDNVSRSDFNAHLTDKNAHSDVVGCTSTSDGVRGFVPQPKKGMQDNYYLGADGSWKQVKQRSVKDIIDIIYPVGSVYTTTGTQNPNQMWAGTTWERYAAGRVLMGAGTYIENGVTYTYTNGATGGEVKHPLTVDEMPSHSHSFAFGTTNISFSFSIRSQSKDAANVLAGTNTTVARREHNSGYAVEPSSAGSWYRDELSFNKNITPTGTMGSTGGNGLHENRQPYTVVNFWRRTA